MTSPEPPADGMPLELTPAPPPAADEQQPASTSPAPGTPSVARVVGRAGWRPWTAWAALLTGFGITVFGGIVVAIVTVAVGGKADDQSPGVNIGLTFFQDCSLITGALIFASMRGRPRAEDFGLRSPADGIVGEEARRAAIGRAIGLLLAVWAAFYAFSAIWVTALGLDEKQTLPDELGVGGSTLNLALVIVLITVVAPLGEELFFRGYFFPALRNWKGFVPAAVLTGIVFGAIHIGSAPLGYVVPLGCFGFGLCVLYHRTDSLLPGIALHALNNSVALGLTQKWSWQIAPTMIGSVIAVLMIATLMGRVLGARAQPRTAAPAIG